jgi:xylulose-5-phosphate/fructose-6-phosphate phosphoketolase
MAAALDIVLAEIRAIQREARTTGTATRPRWPMIVLETLKGWTGPKEVDGQRTEGSWRSHQVPMADFARHPAHLQELEAWMRSYRPEALFDEQGAPLPAVTALARRLVRIRGRTPMPTGGCYSRI